ncbi:MAG: HNH endonuclease [Gammaproteobacteria bacterium]
MTDNDWFENLRHRQDLDEVNFWSPSASTFRALKPGELFLFKLHAPRGGIAGGGVFVHANTLPCSLAWAAFGEGNGAHSASETRAQITRYRKSDPGDRSDFVIGCRILAQPFFFEEPDWIPPPVSWSRQIVTFKTYETDQREGLSLWEAVQERLSRSVEPRLNEQTDRYGPPALIRPRLGQGAFRLVVTESYDRRCAVTGERTLPALEAAHIRPYAAGGLHETPNGLLLRRDIHSLFDAGYVTVTPDLRFEVSRHIREEFENGHDYYALHGRNIRTPKRIRERPDPHALTWHNENCFRG